MSRMDERAVARKLAERDDIEPPAGLLEKIRSEIPAEIRVSPELARSTGVDAEDAVMPRRQRWLIAASLVAAVGAGVLGWELRGRAPAMETVAMEEEEEAVAAPRDAAGNEAPLTLKQAPAPPPAPEAAVQAEDLSEAGQEEPRSMAPTAAAGRAPGSPPSLEAQRREELHETEAEALKVRRDIETALSLTPVQPRDRSATGTPGPAAPTAAPAPAPPRPAPAESLEGLVVREEITVTGVASDARSSSMDSSTLYRQSSGRPSGDPFILTVNTPLSSFGLNVDTASYEAARRSLGDGELPDPGSVRVEEWVNYFHYGDRAPLRADFDVTAEGAPTPFTPGAQYRLVRFNIRGREVDPRNRVIATEAQARVEWNPTVVERYRLLGYESRDGGGLPRGPGPVRGGAEFEAGRSVTALYEIKLQPGIEEEADRRLATLRLRWRSAETGRGSETETSLFGFHLANGWGTASPALRLAAVVAEMAEILKGVSSARDGSLDTVFLEAQRIGSQFPGDAEVAELVSLAGRTARLKATAAEPR